jgi:hypothetical protein
MTARPLALAALATCVLGLAGCEIILGIEDLAAGRTEQGLDAGATPEPPRLGCELLDPSSCGELKCGWLEFEGRTACVPAGPQSEGEFCSYGSDGFDDCDRGLVCADPGETFRCTSPSDVCRCAVICDAERASEDACFSDQLGFGFCDPDRYPFTDLREVGVCRHESDACAPDGSLCTSGETCCSGLCGEDGVCAKPSA